MRSPFHLAPVVLFCVSFALAQSNSAQPAAPKAPPCSQPEFKQMDFWIGEWTATWPAQQGQPEGRGTNIIRKILGDCVVEENFSGAGFDGKSVSTFTARSGKWQQTWVDSSGSYLDFTGGPDGPNFILSRQFTANGKTTMQRMVFKNISHDSFDWSWEKSDDNGKTWAVQWPIHYTRKNATAAK